MQDVLYTWKIPGCSLPWLVFLQGADNNATGCDDLSKKRLETQSVGFCTLRV